MVNVPREKRTIIREGREIQRKSTPHENWRLQAGRNNAEDVQLHAGSGWQQLSTTPPVASFQDVVLVRVDSGGHRK